MAAVTVVSVSRPHVFGDRRFKAGVVTVATTGDTWTVSGMKKITAAWAEPDTARSCGITFTGNVITIATSAGNVALGVVGI